MRPLLHGLSGGRSDDARPQVQRPSSGWAQPLNSENSFHKSFPAFAWVNTHIAWEVEVQPRSSNLQAQWSKLCTEVGGAVHASPASTAMMDWQPSPAPKPQKHKRALCKQLPVIFMTWCRVRGDELYALCRTPLRAFGRVREGDPVGAAACRPEKGCVDRYECHYIPPR